MRPDESLKHTEGQPGLFQAALSGLCPRCSDPTLFEAPARIAISCESCGLDFSELERGARWSGLLTILIAVVLISAAIGIDMALQPPFWLQAVFWSAATITAVLGGLRLYKTALLYAQYEAQSDKEKPSQ
ncbi:DUF983 domain-containing protein [Erythrobacter insulae]|uniref:DUF983 domain-containing protein n=1 Tax=Erythrobacter insulae TaxID=2584124 RepID=A0A547P8R4_9SPHN|nr:DUF983 domain-containing protein [Erythrobacter insulae]TRD10542.1 DUF983 domain-containing protein [Erythrobacter insulae]